MKLNEKKYSVFTIKKISGPYEYPFNLDPENLYIKLELELDGEIYLFKENIPFDYFKEDLDAFQVNKKHIINMNNYNIQKSGAVNVIIEKR